MDVLAGRVTWHFTAVDPDTGKRPPDLPALAGFLPANVVSPQGEGSVRFSVMPKTGLTTGTEIPNQASIVFDPKFNGPIINAPREGPWLNTLDNTKPVSRVRALANVQPFSSFQVQWSGADEGSQIADFTIFVSEEGGPFSTWLFHTTDTSATFTGQPGKTYAFYSVARDQTGNVEDIPSSPHTVTQIKSGPVNVNTLVHLRRNEIVTQFDPTPVPGGPAGTFLIIAKFDNVSAFTIHNVFFRVTHLSGGNVLLNADGGPGGRGAIMTPPGSATTPFPPGATGTFQFRIGLKTRKPFIFKVDMLGEPRTSNATASVLGDAKSSAKFTQPSPQSDSFNFAFDPAKSAAKQARKQP